MSRFLNRSLIRMFVENLLWKQFPIYTHTSVLRFVLFAKQVVPFILKGLLMQGYNRTILLNIVIANPQIHTLPLWREQKKNMIWKVTIFNLVTVEMTACLSWLMEVYTCVVLIGLSLIAICWDNISFHYSQTFHREHMKTFQWSSNLDNSPSSQYLTVGVTLNPVQQP